MLEFKYQNSNGSLIERNILGVREACLYMDISKSYLYKLTHGKILPYSCPNGKKIYFKKDDLDSWMLKNHQSSKEEIKNLASIYIAKKKEVYHG